MPEVKPQDALKDFIEQRPQSHYTFASERGSSVSEICRQNGQGDHDCLTSAPVANECQETLRVDAGSPIVFRAKREPFMLI
ncbi:hypothetical protein CVT26_003446 [Gymnopilus dilepis]|uniref:Uncharacterized protein n=1 Tax=Gymnopilus dilepis TaxID=231916 RepID=A0A409VQI7_9AGAR|nr:hypothetical protein CVT26_003446 [Gymnopilus dilepis]